MPLLVKKHKAFLLEPLAEVVESPHELFSGYRYSSNYVGVVSRVNLTKVYIVWEAPVWLK